MDHPLIDLISARIAEAERNGAFDNLPGAGKPLPPVDDPENAVLHRILKEHGGVPQFVLLSRQMAELREALAGEADRDRRLALMTEMSMLEAKIELARKAGV